MEPLVPMTLTVNVPVDAVELAVIVRVEFAVPPEVGVTGEVTVTVTPAGVVPSHAASKVTGELKPFTEFTAIVAKPLPPCVNVTIELGAASVKSKLVVEVVEVVVTTLPVTVNVAVAESPVEPVAVIVYAPGATLATVNEAVSVPAEIKQLSVAKTPPLVNEQVVSADANPAPDTSTVDPTVAEERLSVIDAVAEDAATVNVVEAESPVEPLA